MALSPAATKLLNSLSASEKQMIKNQVKNPIAAVQYVVKKHGVGLKVAKEVVDTFR